MTEHDKAIWITVEDAEAYDNRRIRNAIEETSLTERYEIIISDDSIETIDLDGLKQALDMNGEESDGWVVE